MTCTKEKKKGNNVKTDPIVSLQSHWVNIEMMRRKWERKYTRCCNSAPPSGLYNQLHTGRCFLKCVLLQSPHWIAS